MSRHQFVAGSAILQMRRFSFSKVLKDYIAIIDALTLRFGQDGSTVCTARPGFEKPRDWLGSGKCDAQNVWERIRERYDVVDEALVHSIGPFVVKVYLLGKTWCVYRPADDALITPLEEPIGMMDASPVICIYGKERSGSYSVLPERLVKEALEVAGTTVAAKLSYKVHAARDDKGEVQGFVAWISMPHADYGDGFGTVTVRCVMQDGGEVPDSLTISH